MELGEYRASIIKGDDGDFTLEIYTKYDTVTKKQYCGVMKEAVLYLGREGYFDEKLPTRIEIFDKFGQIVRIKDMV